LIFFLNIEMTNITINRHDQNHGKL
jgi:hypothetical protein